MLQQSDVYLTQESQEFSNVCVILGQFELFLNGDLYELKKEHLTAELISFIYFMNRQPHHKTI